MNQIQYYKMGQKDKLLIQRIKRIQLDKPSHDFTENVMDYLKEGQTLLKEKDLMYRYNLKKEILPDVPDDFSTKTMEALANSTKKPVFEPLLSKRANAIFISTILIIYIFLLLDGLFFNTIHVSSKTLFKVTWFQDLLTVPPIFWVSIVTLAGLLLIDSVIRKKKILF